LSDFAGWYYRPEERGGIAIISIGKWLFDNTEGGDILSLKMVFDDGSFEGECPLDIEANTLYIEPLGELK
jgi:hypothetical protein